MIHKKQIRMRMGGGGYVIRISLFRELEEFLES